MTNPINAILIGIVSLIAFETIIYWHRNTKGTWKDWPAGRSLMYLLAIIATGFGYGVLNRFFGEYPAKPIVGFLLYGGFIAGLLLIRVTIAKEMKLGKKRLLAVHPEKNGPVDVTVATNNQEIPDADD